MLMCTVLADWALWNNELKACEAVPGCCMLSQYDKSQGRFRISKAVVSTSSKECSTAGTTVRHVTSRLGANHCAPLTGLGKHASGGACRMLGRALLMLGAT